MKHFDKHSAPCFDAAQLTASGPTPAMETSMRDDALGDSNPLLQKGTLDMPTDQSPSA